MRSHHHAEFAGAGRAPGVSVVLPAREEAATIGPIVATCVEQAGQVLVVDAGSRDGTAEIAARAGAEVLQQSDLLPEFGEVLGKGDAMWRALSAVRGEIVVYIDADTERFDEHFVRGLVGPLLADPAVQFVKGFYRRPLRLEGMHLPEGGGRVTELTARPLINRFFPELAGFLQPLAGEIAARRDLLERIPFACGYAVDIAMLIDVWRIAGLDALAQVDLDVRQNQHQTLNALGPMAAAVLSGITRKLEEDGRLEAAPDPGFLAPAAGGFEERGVAFLERPPTGSLALRAS